MIRNEYIQSLLYLVVIFLAVKTGINLFFAYRKHKKNLSEESRKLLTVEILRPLVFVKCFANFLIAVFFPQYILKLTVAAHMPMMLSSLIFSLYQIFFILMLLPSGYFVEILDLKKLLLFASSIEACLFFILGAWQNIWVVLLVQIFFGLIIPVSSSVEYAYIFSLSDEKNRTCALALYFNTLKAASISGIVSGGLLSVYSNEQTTFYLSGLLVLLMLIYIVILVPSIKASRLRKQDSKIIYFNFHQVLKNLPKVFRHLDFIKILIGTGIPFGLLNEGIILFSLPLILSHHHFSYLVIGQILFLFSLGFFVSNKTAAKYADTHQCQPRILLIGLIGIAFSLGLLSVFHWHPHISIIAISVFFLGLFRGFLFSPGNAEVAKNPITLMIGKNIAISLYRFFQVIGSILGPIFIGFLLFQWQYTFAIYLIASMLFIICAAILYFPFKTRS